MFARMTADKNREKKAPRFQAEPFIRNADDGRMGDTAISGFGGLF